MELGKSILELLHEAQMDPVSKVQRFGWLKRLFVYEQISVLDLKWF